MTPDHYNLAQLIDDLSGRDPNQAVAYGFGKPHSYRGYYEDLAFEPVPNTTVGAMLAAAQDAFGQIYTGYKGGEYTMGSYTPVWLAEHGSTGETIGAVMLELMLGPIDTPTN